MGCYEWAATFSPPMEKSHPLPITSIRRQLRFTLAEDSCIYYLLQNLAKFTPLRFQLYINPRLHYQHQRFYRYSKLSFYCGCSFYHFSLSRVYFERFRCPGFKFRLIERVWFRFIYFWIQLVLIWDTKKYFTLELSNLNESMLCNIHNLWWWNPHLFGFREAWNGVLFP